MSQRFDYDGQPGNFSVFDRKRTGGSTRPLAWCREREIAELLVWALRKGYLCKMDIFDHRLDIFEQNT